MTDSFIRTEMLLGREAMERLACARVAVFGLGGVGGYIAEALCRCGIGHFVLIDSDVVSRSNINRQLIALTDSIGKLKTDVMRERMLKINPKAEIKTYTDFFLPGNNSIIDKSIDYIADAIDTVSGKLEIIRQAEAIGIPVISSMGTGNKLNPAMLEVSDIYKTSVCPLAKVMRRELKALGIKRLKVVYSKEKPIAPLPLESAEEAGASVKRQPPGSVSFVPPAAGLLIASEIVKEIGGIYNG